LLTDDLEIVWQTDSNNPDTDGDGYLDGVEIKNGYSPHVGKKVRIYDFDFDQDRLSDWHEYWFKSNIGKKDSDDDGKDDFDAVMRGVSPSDASIIFTRKIIVDLSRQQMEFIVDGIDVKKFPVSTGNPKTPTPEGTFTILDKISKKDYIGPGYHMKDVMWNMLFKKPDFYLHSAYWHNDFGKRTHSHGCINMRVEDAKFLYPYIDINVPLEVIGKTPKKFKVGT
jgi:hypothetical protein